MVAGAINAYGFPLTKIITLPWNKYLQHLSGLSVEMSWGTPKVSSSSNNCSNWPVESKESIDKLLSLNFTSPTKSEFAIFFM